MALGSLYPPGIQPSRVSRQLMSTRELQLFSWMNTLQERKAGGSGSQAGQAGQAKTHVGRPGKLGGEVLGLKVLQLYT